MYCMGIERYLFLSESDIVVLSYHIATVSLYCMICLQLLGTVFDTWPDSHLKYSHISHCKKNEVNQ